MFIDAVGPTDDVFGLAQDKRGRGPLHYAASKASVESCHSDSPSLGLPVDAKDASGLTPLMCAVGIPFAQGVDVCRLLARRKEMSISARNRDGLSAIHLAAIANNLPVLKLFAEEMGKNVEVFDNDNCTPLHYAAEQGHYEIVQLLLACGARTISGMRVLLTMLLNLVSAVSISFLRKRTTWYVSAKIIGRKEIKDRENRSCLMWAVCAGNVEVIEYLVRKTSPDRQARDNHGFTALHLAAMVGNENICKVLVRQGWNPSERDKLDNTPLHLAAGRGHTDVVRFLVTAGANMNEKDAMDRTPVYWACFGGQAHTLYCMIKELGFEWRTVDKHRRVPITDALGQTPLHAAAFAGFTACINVLLNIEAEDDCLISPLTGWKDKHGETALHVACSRGKMDCVLALLKGGAAPNAVNDAKKTCLQCAIDNKHSNIAEYLRSQGALVFTELSETAARVIQTWWRTIIIRRRLRKVRL
ncbi:NAD(P)H-quinone oxidoreductase subunit 5, chloroplastic [Parelaphostrongylus tenuis]|uniref:NAD(P)H-quinone oxidoreductase subunit 5, chloroplastic n=1 Tax=Parelaphostrongylus tenuis TaxID=148309 RepID=A0AAD5MDN7_PARTN|nr:NAD(P)H-quinone oxidoreductase subunit 5, chloroplastic [Parelaphostrongylus tenuis]